MIGNNAADIRDPKTVAVIVECDGAERIAALADRVHVWAIDTPENRRKAEAVWRRRVGNQHELSMTLFPFDPVAPDQIVLDVLESIDLHHGEFSQSPAWSRAKVYGALPTPSLTTELHRFGFFHIDEIDGGFVAWRD